jgi:hypothetical protein
MKVGNGEFLNQAACLFKGLLGLTWKAWEDINAYGCIRYRAGDVVDQVSEKFGAIGSVHPLKYLIVPTLEGDVKVRTNPLRHGHVPNEVF